MIGVDKAQQQERHEKILRTARPILFNTDMVLAILDGRKTVTRRVIKFPPNKFTGEIPKADEITVYEKTLYHESVGFHIEPFYGMDVKKPYERLDYLYVRETWKQATIDPAGGGCALQDIYLYKADEPIDTTGMLVEPRWHPSIHMPKEAARIFLRVTDVRVERLNDMDYMDAIYEGIEPILGEEGYPEYNPMIDFIDLWDSTIKPVNHDKYGWDANPWVFVVEFEKINLSEVKENVSK